MNSRSTNTPLVQDLAGYSTPLNWTTGASFHVRALWFFFGQPLFYSPLIPGSHWRCLLLRLFGSRIGTNCVLKPGIKVKFPWRLTLGNNCWIGEDVWIDNLASVSIGDNACISQGVYFCTGNHNYRTSSFDLIVKPILIEDQSWIGAFSIIAPGVTIASQSIVSLGSVVSTDVNYNEVVSGNPAKFVRLRHN